MEFSKRLTDNARESLAQAEVISHLGHSSYVGTEHLLLAILNQDVSVGARALHEAGVDFESVRSALHISPSAISIVTSGTGKNFSDTLKLSLRMAAELATEFHQDYCGTVHLLFSILSQKDSKAVEALLNIGADIEAILNLLDEYLEGKDNMAYETASGNENDKQSRMGGSFIKKYSRDLVEAARQGELDPVIGRTKELDRMLTILSRRTKNNPVLVGDAGVGKTAIVEGLASRIAGGEVPDFLADKRVLELDLAGMVAGTKYRGEFEDRLKRVINEVEKDDKLIVFIDEIHLLMGAGNPSGSMDAANILKPALARGKFRLIGATTGDEYRKYIEKDSALTRRLQEITVDAPNDKDTIRIITGLAPRYEDYHHVKIAKPVIEEAVRLSDRYLPERQQPDKAIDVIDETAARVHIANASNKAAVDLRSYRAECKRLSDEMEKAVAAEDYEKAALYKMRSSRLKEKIDELETEQKKESHTVKLNDVATTVSTMTGVPLEQLQRSEAVRLLNLEKRLSSRIIGQSQAVHAVAESIKRSRAGISDMHRPIGSFIFLGPTGVGKTELAKVLADEVFGSRRNLIKVDMSEFSERHNVARLVGAPAGYVGYDDGGQLTEKVRRQPYSVVLFDEIEKAHPSVFNILLQILEDGVLTDGHGKKVDFSNCVIILTSNIGANEMASEAMGFKLGDGTVSDAKRAGEEAIVMKRLHETMRPELLNRFDQIILFNNLSEKEVGQIFDLILDDLNRRLAVKGIGLVVNSAVKKYLVNKGYDAKYGARPLRRVIQEELEQPLAEEIIAGKAKIGEVLKAALSGGRIVLSKVKEDSGVTTRKAQRAVKSN